MAVDSGKIIFSSHICFNVFIITVSRLSPALDLSFMLTKFKNYSTDEYSTMVNNEVSKILSQTAVE